MFEITIRRDGETEPFTVTAGTRDVLRWEKTNKKKRTLAALEKDMAIEDFYAIAYYASRRGGQFVGSLTEFEDQCDIDVQETAEEDPTPPGHSPGHSSTSPWPQV